MAGEFTLKIAGHVAQYAPEGKAEFALVADGRPLQDILKGMGMEKGLLRVLVVAGERVRPDYVPKEGDVVTLIAPASGG